MLAAPNVLGRPIRRPPGGLSALAGLSGSQIRRLFGKRLGVRPRERLQREPLIYAQSLQTWRRSPGCAAFVMFIISVARSSAQSALPRRRGGEANWVEAARPTLDLSARHRSRPEAEVPFSVTSDRTRRTGDVAAPPGREKQCGEECRLRQTCAGQLRPIASELICRANSAIVKGLSSFGKFALALSRWEYPVARSNGSPGQTSRINSAKAKPVISGIA